MDRRQKRADPQRGGVLSFNPTASPLISERAVNIVKIPGAASGEGVVEVVQEQVEEDKAVFFDSELTSEQGVKFTKKGAGILKFNKEITEDDYAGETVIQAGTLAFGGGGTIKEKISGAGKLRKDAGNELRLNSQVDYAGQIEISAGTLIFEGGGTVSGTISGAGTLRTEGNNNTLTLTQALDYDGEIQIDLGTGQQPGTLALSGGGTLKGKISGTGKLKKEGDNTLTLNKEVKVANYTGDIEIAAGTLAFEGGGTVNGTISGTGKLKKEGDNTLTLTDTIKALYTGEIEVEEGTLALSGGGTVNGNISIEKTETKEGTLAFAVGGTVNGTISGAGTLNKTGGGAVTLNQELQDYTGAISIERTGSVVFAGGGTVSGNISGAGELVVTNNMLTLSGDNTGLTGTLTVFGAGTTLDIEKDASLGAPGRRRSITIGNGATLRTDRSITLQANRQIDFTSSSIEVTQGQKLTCDGTSILGNETVKKTGKGSLSLEGSNPQAFTGLAGTFEVTAGEVSIGKNMVFGLLQDPDALKIKPVNLEPENEAVFMMLDDARCEKKVVIDQGGKLMGVGTYAKNIENSGTLKPGLSTGTLKIEGDYIQQAHGILVIDVDDPNTYSVLEVEGTTTLKKDSEVRFVLKPGYYPKGQKYEFIKSKGGFAQGENTFSKVTFGKLTFKSKDINEQGDSLILTAPESEGLGILNWNPLKGNAKVIAKYLFTDLTFLSKDLEKICEELLSQTSLDALKSDLLQIGPEPLGALPLVTLQSGTRLGKEMGRAEKNYKKTYSKGKEVSQGQKEPGPMGSVWVSPIGYYYKQDAQKEQVPFQSTAYGFALGYQADLSDRLALNSAVGYTHSKLGWHQNRGDATVQSVYLSPSLSYFGSYGYIGALVAGGMSFYDANRKIAVLDMKKTAHSNHKSFDLLFSVCGALQVGAGKIGMNQLVFVPSVHLDLLNVFENKYRESGAGPLNLFVSSKFSSYLRPEAKLQVMQKIQSENAYFLPSVYVGWVKNVLLNRNKYESIFAGRIKERQPFAVQSYHSLRNQLLLGAALYMKYKDALSLTISYEANLADSTYVQEGKLTVGWKF